MKKSHGVTKGPGRARKRQKLDKGISNDDLQANKENNMPTPMSKKGANSKIGANLRKRSIKNSYEKSIKEEISEDETQGKRSTKRISLKKKTLPESASKLSISGSNKENSEWIKTPSSSDLPRNTYGLRRRGRGRKPKKSHIYKSEENLIFSHEKDEEMNKHDDSEFKLPNEDKSMKPKF